VILPESTLEEAKKVCQKLCETIKKSTEGSGISCSMGVAISSPENNHDTNLLVKKADKAMYEAKKEAGFTVKAAKI
jgi:GGDEF domain-containing protein